MKFVYYDNLTDEAKRAFNSTKAKSHGFCVNMGCIAKLDKNGRAMDFVKVIKTKSKDII